MLRVEIDMFSGRSNPVWMITEADEANKLVLDAVSEAPAMVAKPGAGFTGLGFREIRIEVLSDDERSRRGAPKRFALASTAAKDLRASGEVAQRLIKAMPLKSDIRLREHETTPLDSRLRDFVLRRLADYLREPPRPPPPPPEPPRNPLRTTVDDRQCTECQYEVSQYNPAFWNNAATQRYNNCYNYGRNWKTNTFAQPGRAHGAQTGVMACSNVATAAMADGLVRRCRCLPQSEWPRRLMALVIDPGNDYHWYREQRGGFWGHKPGPGTARNYDDSSVLITDPQTCNRGHYTNFCEFFYAGKSVVIN